MNLEVEGYILSEVPYGETSKVINVFTKDFGIIGIMCKGAKGIKSKNRVATMKLSYAKFNILYKKNKLSTLISADIINPLKTIKSDIILVGFLTYLSDLTYQVLKQSNLCNEIYDIFIEGIKKIENKLDPIVITNIIEIKYLEYLGILFNLNECTLCGSKKNIITVSADKGGYICQNCLTNEVIVSAKIIKMLRIYYYVNISSIKEINVDDKTKNSINMFLNEYYDKYAGLYLNSKSFLNKMLSGEYYG